MIAHRVKQNNDDWLRLRLGIPTASDADDIISGATWKVRTGQMRKTYLLKKLTERVTGQQQGGDFSAWAVEQGQILERYALPWVEFTQDIKLDRTVGFCTTDDGKCGCSPDSLIGEDGGAEIKCLQDKHHLEVLLNGSLPDEFAAQVHASLWVTGRAWWRFIAFSRKFPPLMLTIQRDESIMTAISNAVTQFNVELDAAHAKLLLLMEADGTAMKPRAV